jgi:anthraniloyl-CoA monooxygenase
MMFSTMNIAVVGAGPVGLYAASWLKHLYADSQVRVFEKRSQDQLAGFGYTPFTTGACSF